MKVGECKLIKPDTCKEDLTVIEVAKNLKNGHLKHIIITDSKNKPLGVISITDIAFKIVAEEKDPKTLKAKDIMSTPVYTIESEDDLTKAQEEMTSKNRVFLPVVKKGTLQGILTFNELVKGLISSKKEQK